MKTHFFKLLLLSIFIISFYNCSSNEPEEIIEPIVCQNGGTSIDGGCNCPEGYSGEDCSIQDRPSSINIKKVIIRAFPNQRPDGSLWDNILFTDPDDGLPDIYFTLENNNSILLYDSPTFYENAISNGTNAYEFVPQNSITISNFNNPYIINILDYDINNEDDSMVLEAFSIYDEQGGFPSTITVLNAAKPILVDLELEYEF